VYGHTLISDDEGHTWRVGDAVGIGSGDLYVNEVQAVELMNSSVLANARSLADPGYEQRRLQAVSDDGGAHFGPARFVTDLPQPIDGCEGSIISAGAGHPPRLFFSGPNSRLLRTAMTLWTSDDEGASWQVLQEIDPGTSGYSSLQVEEGPHGVEALLLYEQSDSMQLVMDPDRFVFRRLSIPARAHSTQRARIEADGYSDGDGTDALSFVGVVV